MKKQKLSLIILLVILSLPFLWNGSGLVAQNVAITDDDTYNADGSAMLDVKSLTKGMLVPRLTSVQRNAVSSPATGLLVFDTDAGSFYFYNGTSWLNLTSGNASGIWSYTSPDKVYLSDVNDKLGVGTVSPIGKMEVKSDVSIGNESPIFNVVNSTGDTVFAVYEQGVRINVYDDPLVKASGSKGGFAVGGFSPAKGTTTNEYLRITPDSVRIYIEESGVAKASGSKGGFAVGGFSPAKAGITNEYLRITNDSTRIYTEDPVKGFGVRDIGAGSVKSYMQMTPNNCFIGHESGNNNSTGIFNSYLGYRTGKFNTNGSYNTYIGYQTGLYAQSAYNTAVGTGSLNYTTGVSNVAIGVFSLLYNTKGDNNIGIGTASLQNNTTAAKNIAIGSFSLFTQSYNNSDTYWSCENIAVGHNALFSNQPTSISNGNQNIALGTEAMYYNTTGNNNISLGNYSLYSNISGYRNIAVGIQSMYYNTTGFNNTSIGNYSLYSNISGERNVAIGNFSLFTNISGNYNTSVGGSALTSNNTGNYNTAVGFDALNANSSGQSNVAVGKSSLIYNSGSQNTAIGTNSGFYDFNHANYSGSNNTFIGFNTGLGSTVQRNNATSIGYNALVDCDNCMVLGGTGADAVKVGIGTNAPGSILHLNNPTGTAIITMTQNYDAKIETSNDVANGTSLRFYTTNSTVTAEKMRINNAGNVGIGTMSPNSKLQVTEGDVYVGTIGNGVIIRSPDGTCYRVTVDNGGALVTTSVACP